MKLHAVIFDVDGTLLDNLVSIRGMERLFRARYPDRRLPQDFFLHNNANTRIKNAELVGLPFEEYNALVEENLAGIEPEILRSNDYPGVYDMLKKLHAAGYILGINTSRTRALLERGFGWHPDLFSLFHPDYIVTASDVAHPKPAPDSLEYLCGTHALRKGELLYIGDAVHDVQCARAAGVPFAWASWGWHFVPEGIAESDVLLHRPNDIFGCIAQQEKELSE